MNTAASLAEKAELAHMIISLGEDQLRDFCTTINAPELDVLRWATEVHREFRAEERSELRRLIAAAPEMLKALKGLLATQDADEWDAAADIANAAIAKAEGTK